MKTLLDEIMQLSDLFYCYAVPRRATEDEIGALYDYFEYAEGMGRGDAQGKVEVMTLAVYDGKCSILHENSDKVIVAFAGGEPNMVYVFAVQNGELTLARTYWDTSAAPHQ